MTTISDFWLNLRDSGLLDSQQCADLRQQFARLVTEKPEMDQPKSVAAWLIKSGKLTSYQAKVLLKGRKGPFDFGRYRVTNRMTQGALNGWFQANHIDTGHAVFLHFLTGEQFKNPAVWSQVTEQVKAVATIKDSRIWRVFDLVDQVSLL